MARLQGLQHGCTLEDSPRHVDMPMLLGLSLALIGIVAGVYVATMIHDHRIADLSAAQYIALHQMRDKTFRKVMPVLGSTTLGLVLISTVVGLASGTPRLLGAAAVVLLMLDIALAMSRQLPLNRTIQSWTETAVPDHWARVRDHWALHHNLRTVLGMAAYACYLAAVLGTMAR
jgi:uncharacterized membrane protein